MKRSKAFRHSAGLDDTDGVAMQTQIAESIHLPRVDDTAAAARPKAVSSFYVESEYDQLEAEQEPLWGASGEDASRNPQIEAAGLTVGADVAKALLSAHEPVVNATRAEYLETAAALEPFRRRPAGSKVFHYSAKSALLMGDIVGVTLMGVSIGDVPVLALLTSLGAGTATVIAGLVGTEVKDIRGAQRRQIDPGQLTEIQAKHRHLFNGVNQGKKTVRAIVGASCASGLLIALAIFAGRAELEGSLTGLMYGGIAAAVATASFAEQYHWTDEVADKIDGAEYRMLKAMKRHQKLAAATPLVTHAEKVTESESIKNEHELRGIAAMARIASIKFGILRRSPGVAGHGPSSDARIGRVERVEVTR